MMQYFLLGTPFHPYKFTVGLWTLLLFELKGVYKLLIACDPQLVNHYGVQICDINFCKQGLSALCSLLHLLGQTYAMSFGTYYFIPANYKLPFMCFI